MRIIDVDGHFAEPKDWLDVFDPGLAAELEPGTYYELVVEKFVRPGYNAMSADRRPASFEDLLPQGFAQFIRATADLQPDCYDPSGKDPAYGAEGRLRYCDDHGIDVQFLNPTYLNRETMLARHTGRAEILKRVVSAWNAWAAEQVEGCQDRLVPVTQTLSSDPAWSTQELERMRDRGSLAFSLDRAPGSKNKSLTHPDFDVLWSAAEDLGMTLFLHVGINEETIAPGWHDNGTNQATMFLINSLVLATPQIVLSAMVIDGVFDRHPRLKVVVEEMGFVWMPTFLTSLDRGLTSPTLGGTSYRYPLKPSEYIQNQVKVTPLTFDPLHPTIDALPSDMLIFSTDYPHLEGNAEAVTFFDEMLSQDSVSTREGFFGRAAEAFLGV